MAAMEVEPEDERHSLICNITRHAVIYKTPRSRRIRGRLCGWSREGRNPDSDHGGRPYIFVSDCCALSINLQNEIITMYYAPVRHCFHRFFPELDSLVVDPADYLRVVRRIIRGSEARDVTFSDGLLLDLQQEGLLPPSMVTTVVAVRSSLSACPAILSRETTSKMLTACNRAFALESISKELDAFVHRGGRIGLLVPNLSALVGAAVAANLIGAAGGLSELSTLPISDIPLLSAANCRKDRHHEKSLANCHPVFDHPPHELLLPDHIMGCYAPRTDLIRSTPQPRLQSRACHSLAERIRLAATIDLNRGDPTGEKGRAMGEEIRTMIEMWKDEDAAMLMKLRTEPTERPKKDKLAVSTDYSRMFKPNPIKEKPRSKRDDKRAERLLSSLKEFGLTPTATARTPTPTPPPTLSLKAI